MRHSKLGWRVFILGGKKRIHRLITATFRRWTHATKIPARTFIVKIFGSRTKITHEPWYAISWAPKRSKRVYIFLNERKLAGLPDKAIVGLITHELAHITLKHHRRTDEEMFNFYLLF